MQISSGGSSSPSALDAWRAQMQAKIFNGLDSNSSGGISLSEFEAGLQNLPGGNSAPANGAAGPASAASTTATAGNSSQAALENAFKAIDTDGNGQISPNELGAAMQAKEHHGHHHHHASAANGQDGNTQDASQQGGVTSTLAAQLLGQGQAVPGATATGTGTAPPNDGDGDDGSSTTPTITGQAASTGTGATGATDWAAQARELLMRYAMGQGSGAASGGVSLAA